MAMTDNRLQPGDEIRVIAPSISFDAKKPDRYDRAKQVLTSLGYKVSYGENVRSSGRFGTAEAAMRIDDFHAAYADPKVKAVIAAHGGWSANALLPLIDWNIVQNNPKPLIGFSDITVLINAIYAKTSIVGYLGPNFSSLGSKQLQDYTVNNLANILSSNSDRLLKKSEAWYKRRDRKPVRTAVWKTLQTGQAEGVLIGGNIGTFYLLQGTEFQPRFDRPFILTIEDDAEAGKYTAREFDRRLESLLQLPNVRLNLRGVLIGRFEQESRVTMPDVIDVVGRLLPRDVPIVAGMDFGHTAPLLTLPIGGCVSMDVTDNKQSINLVEW